MKFVWLHMGWRRDINFPMVYHCVNNYFAEKNIFLQLEWLEIICQYLISEVKGCWKLVCRYLIFDVLFGSFGFAKKLNFFVFLCRFLFHVMKKLDLLWGSLYFKLFIFNLTSNVLTVVYYLLQLRVTAVLITSKRNRKPDSNGDREFVKLHFNNEDKKYRLLIVN